MSQVREDRVQMRIEFITDESKQFAQTIENTKKFNQEIAAAQKEVSKLEKEIANLEAKDMSTIGKTLDLAAAQAKLTQAINGSVRAGQGLSELDLSRVAPDTLSERLRQINAQLKSIPQHLRETHPDAQKLVTEADRIKEALERVKGKAKEVAETVKSVESAVGSYEHLRKSVHELETELKHLAPDTEDFINKSKRLREVEAEFKRVERALKGIETPNLATGSLGQLKEKAKQLRAELDTLPPGTAAFIAKLRELGIANRQIEQTEADIRRVSSAMHEARASTGGFFQTLTNVIGRVMMLWYGLQQAFSVLWKPSELSSQMESVRLSMETMLGSVSHAAKMTREIMVLAMNTNFESGELTEFVKRLLAMGVESKNVIKDITMLGDVAAGVGKEKLDRIVLAFGQVAAKTKLAGGELKQFVEAGVPLVGALADMMKKSESQIYKMVEAGEIGFDKVEAAFAQMTSQGGKFYGLMAKQAQTLPGLLSTLNDHLKLSFAAFGDGFNVAMKEIVRSLIEVTKSMDKQAWQEFGTAVGKAVKFVWDFVPALVRFTATFATVWAVTRVGTVLLPLLTGSFTALSAAIKLNPIGLIATAAAFAITAVSQLTEKMNALTESQKTLTEVKENANQAASTEIEKSNELFSVINSVTASKEQKTAAYKRLQALHPSVMAQYASESDFLANLSAAHDKVTESILQQSFAKAKAAKQDEISRQMIELEMKKADAQKELDAQKAANQSVTHDLGDGMTVTTDNSANVAKAQKVHDDLVKQSKEKIELYEKVSEASNNASKDAIAALSKTQTGLNKQAQEIEIVKRRIKADPKDESAKLRLAELEKQHRFEIDAVVELNQKKKIISHEEDKKALAAAKKVAKDHLGDLEAANQEEINELTLKYLKAGKMEEDFAVELLEVKKAGLQKELNYAQAHAKELGHVATKKGTEIVKIEKAIREKLYKNELSDLENHYKTRQTAVDLERANELITEHQFKMRLLELKRGKFTEELAVLARHGKLNSDEYAKILLERAKTEKEIADATLQESLSVAKNRTTRLLQVESLRFEQGEIGEKAHKRNVLKIELEGVQAEMDILKRRGETDTETYRSLSLKRLQLVKSGQQAEIDALLDGVHRMSQSELEALSDALEAKRITQRQFDMLMLQDKEKSLRESMNLLKTNNLEQSDAYKKLQKELTDNQKQQSKTRVQIEKEEAAQKKKFYGQLGEAFHSFLSNQISTEIEMLSQSEEDKKANAEKIKGLRKQQVEIDTFSSIAKIWLNSQELGPIFGPILASVQTGFALKQMFDLLGKIDSAKMAKGGVLKMLGGETHANGGTKGVFDDGTTVEMERGEVLAVVNAQNAPMLKMLSLVNGHKGNGTPFFAGGGLLLPNTTPNPSQFFTTQNHYQQPNNPGTNDELLKLFLVKFDALQKSVEKQKEIKFYRDKLQDAYDSDASDRDYAAWKL